MLPPRVLDLGLQELDRIKRGVFQTTLQTEMTEIQWLLAKQPSSGIGMALGDPENVATASHLASLGDTSRTLKRLAESQLREANIPKVQMLDGIRAALGRSGGLEGLLSEMQRLVDTVEVQEKITNLPGTDQLEIMPKSQRMRRYYEAQQRRHILASPTWTPIQLARIRSGGEGGAGAWLDALPVMGPLKADTQTFLHMMRTRLQIDWVETHKVQRCICGKQQDAHFLSGAHFTLMCPKHGKYDSHRAVVKTMENMYRQLGVQYATEPIGLSQDSESRPADVMVVVPSEAQPGAMRAVAWDAGVTDPGGQQHVIMGSDKVPLLAAKLRTKQKEDQFEARSVTHPPTLQFDYKPVVYETTSARGASAKEWWDGICQMAKDKESPFGLGFGSLMEYNGLAFAWTGQTFQRHWAIRMSFSIMYSAHKVGVSRVHELSLTQGEERATRGGRAASLN